MAQCIHQWCASGGRRAIDFVRTHWCIHFVSKHIKREKKSVAVLAVFGGSHPHTHTTSALTSRPKIDLLRRRRKSAVTVRTCTHHQFSPQVLPILPRHAHQANLDVLTSRCFGRCCAFMGVLISGTHSHMLSTHARAGWVA